MRFNIAQLLKEPIGSIRDYPLQESFTDPERVSDSAQGHVHLLRTHQGVLATAELDVVVSLTCSRCLSSFTQLSNIRVEEEFFPTVDINSGSPAPPPETVAREGALRIDSNHVLDFHEALRQYVITDAPMKPLCREGCRGLCQVCGANQNQTTCDCDRFRPDPRWQSLGAILGR